MKNHQKQIRPIEHYGSFHAATVNKHTTYDNSGHLNPQRTHQQHDLYCWNEVQNDLSQKSSLPKAFLHIEVSGFFFLIPPEWNQNRSIEHEQRSGM